MFAPILTINCKSLQTKYISLNLYTEKLKYQICIMLIIQFSLEL